MTPKEKAIELRELFFNKCNVTIAGTYTIFRELSKDIAIAAVDEILKGEHLIRTPLSFWQKVKGEIKGLK